MGAINVITLPGYYYLYALYFDYPVNNEFFLVEENAEKVRKLVRAVQSIQALRAPYRKSWAVRLFTGRDAGARFSPETVNTLLFQLREAVEQLGPPPGWKRGPLPPARAPARPSHRFSGNGRTATPARGGAAAPRAPAPSRPPIPFPPAPIPIKLIV